MAKIKWHAGDGSIEEEAALEDIRGGVNRFMSSVDEDLIVTAFHSGGEENGTALGFVIRGERDSLLHWGVLTDDSGKEHLIVAIRDHHERTTLVKALRWLGSQLNQMDTKGWS